MNERGESLLKQANLPRPQTFRVVMMGDFVEALPITKGLLDACMQEGMTRGQALWWIFRHRVEYDIDEELVRDVHTYAQGG